MMLGRKQQKYIPSGEAKDQDIVIGNIKIVKVNFGIA